MCVSSLRGPPSLRCHASSTASLPQPLQLEPRCNIAERTAGGVRVHSNRGSHQGSGSPSFSPMVISPGSSVHHRDTETLNIWSLRPHLLGWCCVWRWCWRWCWRLVVLVVCGGAGGAGSGGGGHSNSHRGNQRPHDNQQQHTAMEQQSHTSELKLRTLFLDKPDDLQHLVNARCTRLGVFSTGVDLCRSATLAGSLSMRMPCTHAPRVAHTPTHAAAAAAAAAPGRAHSASPLCPPSRTPC